MNRKSMPPLAMKYAIGGIFFLACGFGMSLHPAMFNPRMTTESPTKVSHEVGNWQKIVFTFFAHVRLDGELRENVGHKIFPKPIRRDHDRS